MSWAALAPIVEKLIDAGIEYYRTEGSTQSLSTEASLEQENPGDGVFLVTGKVTGNRAEVIQRVTEALQGVEGFELGLVQLSQEPGSGT
jgi:hypothetical protein